jgi:hypothetical protein
MSILRGRAEPLSVYGAFAMLLFFVGCVAVVLAAALSVGWLLALWGVSWVASLVLAVTGSVKS